MKYVIIGGVAAGASVAARLRRLEENAEIILLERGAYISYANCGLPYHLSGVISQRESLLVTTPEKMTARFNIDIRTHHEVTRINREQRILTIQTPQGEKTESYDKLLIATGSSPIMVNLPGSDDSRIFPLWKIPDMDGILEVIPKAHKAVVVGAGFIGLETAENLRERGLDVTIVELAPQILAPFDQEMTTPLANELHNQGIHLQLGKKVVSFTSTENSLTVHLDSGESLNTDLVIMSVGIKPNSELAKDCQLEIGPRGHIIVNDHLRTSDPHIYAAGDVIEVLDPILDGKTAIPLAGPANRQARVAANNMVGGDDHYLGSIGTSIVKVGKFAGACVGYNERKLKQLQIDYQKTYLYPSSHVTYYPGATPLTIKVIFDSKGSILGAQVIGQKEVDKQIDAIAIAIQGKLKITDLADSELAYAPPFSSAKSPLNFMGMIAENIMTGLTTQIYVENLQPQDILIDTREKAEVELGSIPGAINIPLSEFRQHLSKLDPQASYITFCQVGLRGYIAEQILKQHHFQVKNLSGGFLTWKLFNPDQFGLGSSSNCTDSNCSQKSPSPQTSAPNTTQTVNTSQAETIDVRALACPGPVVRLKQSIDQIKEEQTIRFLAPISFLPDLRSWLKNSGHHLVNLQEHDDFLEAFIQKKSATNPIVSPSFATSQQAAIVLFSNDLDKAMAALIIANGMAASGMKVGIFFTFWGLSILRKNPAPVVNKSLVQRLFGFMLPKGPTQASLSKMNFGGMGSMMMKNIMAQQNVASLEELLLQARSLGVRFVACEMAMNVMGISREELINIDEVAGVANFVEMARESNNTLFI